MHIHPWWLAVGALVLVFGDNQDRRWMGVTLALVAVVWAVSAHGTTSIMVVLGFCIATVTFAAWKYLSQPQRKDEPPSPPETPA